MANRNVEVFDNSFDNNQTVHIAVVAGDLESGDDNYDPFPKGIQTVSYTHLTLPTKA